MTRNVIIARIGQAFEIIGEPPVGHYGAPYAYTFGTAGGLGPITWRCTPNPLGTSGAAFAAGLLDSASLTDAGAFAFRLEAIDANRQRAQRDYVLTITGTAPGYRLVTEAGNPIISEAGAPMVPQ